jgi:hypothetical protein
MLGVCPQPPAFSTAGNAARGWLPVTRSVTVAARKREALPEHDPSTITWLKAGLCQRCHLARLLAVYTEWVTAKEQLQQLVAHLGEEQASRALRLLEPLSEELPEHKQAPALPEFVGIADSGRSDVSEHVDELLAEGFGR